MKYDIFISYRRDGGYTTAKHLNDLLVRDGYKVSFDIDTLGIGDFDTQLLKRIDQCKDFILIVDKHAFDRTLDPDFNPNHDWLRCELKYALKQNKNIIPIMLSGVNNFPENLPDDIKGVSTKNAPEYDKYYFNEFYSKLKDEFLTSRSIKYKIKGTLVIVVAICILALGLSFLLTSNNENETIVKYVDPTNPHPTTESEFILYAKTMLEKYVEDNNLKENDLPDKLLVNAQRGDSESQFLLGLSYVSAYNVEPDYLKAIEWFNKSAKQGNQQALFSLGVCYYNGLDVKQDQNKASKYFQKSAENEFAPAMYDYVLSSPTMTNEKGLKYIKSAAVQGFAPAQVTLSRLYWFSYPDFKESMYWCNLAVGQNYKWAELWLSNIYGFAPEEERDVDKAVEILEKLSEQGFSYAQLYLGSLYFNGLCEMEVDIAKAFELWDKASNNNNPCAQYLLGYYYLIGENELNGKRVDYNKALEYLKKSSDQGFPYAFYQISEMYKKGYGVEKNLDEAKKWEQKAKDAGYSEYQQQQLYQQQNPHKY